MTANEFGNSLKKVGKEISDLPVFLMDAGHGGIINGVYQTSGKRSPVWPDGRQLFEGEFNRDIVKRLMHLMSECGIPHVDLVPTQEDIPLRKRTDDANEFYKKNKNCVYLSIHANAASNPKATGFEIFTSVGDTGKADDYSEIIFEEYKLAFPELKTRTDDDDGDHDKEARFHVLDKTHMPAILIECSFMTCLSPDCELLMSEEGRNRIAGAIFKGILKICQSQKK